MEKQNMKFEYYTIMLRGGPVGYQFFIDTNGSITGLYRMKFDNFESAYEYAKTKVQYTFPNFEIFVEKNINEFPKPNSVRV